MQRGRDDVIGFGEDLPHPFAREQLAVELHDVLDEVLVVLPSIGLRRTPSLAYFSNLELERLHRRMQRSLALKVRLLQELLYPLPATQFARWPTAPLSAYVGYQGVEGLDLAAM